MENGVEFKLIACLMKIHDMQRAGWCQTRYCVGGGRLLVELAVPHWISGRDYRKEDGEAYWQGDVDFMGEGAENKLESFKQILEVLEKNKGVF